MLLSQPNVWHNSDFNSSAVQRGQLKPHAHTLTQFFDSAGLSCSFHCQSHNTRWRESNRECKRKRVWQWFEYLLGHCSWLCISPHFWMGIFSSQVQRYYRRWLEINNKSSEGSLKPDQFCNLIQCPLARDPTLICVSVSLSFVSVYLLQWTLGQEHRSLCQKKYIHFKVKESWTRIFFNCNLNFKKYVNVYFYKIRDTQNIDYQLKFL